MDGVSIFKLGIPIERSGAYTCKLGAFTWRERASILMDEFLMERSGAYTCKLAAFTWREGASILMDGFTALTFCTFSSTKGVSMVKFRAETFALISSDDGMRA